MTSVLLKTENLRSKRKYSPQGPFKIRYKLTYVKKNWSDDRFFNLYEEAFASRTFLIFMQPKPFIYLSFFYNLLTHIVQIVSLYFGFLLYVLLCYENLLVAKFMTIKSGRYFLSERLS